MRTDRVMRKPVPVPWTSPPQGGRPPKHGKEFPFAKPDTWGEPDADTAAVTDRYGIVRAMTWDRIHPLSPWGPDASVVLPECRHPDNHPG